MAKYLMIGLCVIAPLLLVTTNGACHGNGAASQKATCELIGSVQGTLVLEQKGKDLVIEGKLSNITFGPHAIHVHQNGATGNNCADAGGHYNPTNVDHGGPTDEPDRRHVGDWGNLNVQSDPYALKITDNISKLNDPFSIVGRAIVIHAGEDDLGRGTDQNSKLNGNAGGRLACCVITSI